MKQFALIFFASILFCASGIAIAVANSRTQGQAGLCQRIEFKGKTSFEMVKEYKACLES